MMKSAIELLSETLQNPLVKHLPQFLTSGQMAEKLANRPFENVDWTAVPPEQRLVLLNELKATFCVTEMALRIAMAMQSLLWDGLLARDPRKPEQRRLIYEIAEYDFQQFDAQPWRNEFIGGATIRGITGVGKSAAANRFLSLIPQVIRHGKNDAVEWVELSQLVYLKVHMSADGSRAGFLLNCLLAMDNALGSDYFKLHQGKKLTVEKLLVVVLQYLAVHRCGLLIIEEAQEENLTKSHFSRAFLTFFLRLLNHGIPVVIIGNPLAFGELDMFSQNQSRFSEYGDFRIDPVLDFNDEEWQAEWIGYVWSVTLLDEADDEIDDLAELIWNCTGGFPRNLARLRRETINAAIQMGSSRVCKEHIEVAMSAPPMVGTAELVSVFTSRNWRSLEKFRDIPIGYFRSKWDSLNANGLKTDDEGESEGTGVTAPLETEISGKAAAKKTRMKKDVAKKGNKSKKSAATPPKYDPEDIRSQEYVDSL